MSLSISEENYLKAIYKITGSEENRYAGTNELSKILNLKAGSTTEMIKKLHEKKLIEYKKYHGVRLSKKGNRIAIKTVRKHRLWEVFLVESLGYKWDEVHEIAEQMEHIGDDELTARLDKFLNFPKFDPHGDPIPNKEGAIANNPNITLSESPLNKKVKFIGVKTSDAEFLKYLSKIGFEIGNDITVVDTNPYDELIEIKINKNKTTITVSNKTASNIYIKK